MLLGCMALILQILIWWTRQQAQVKVDKRDLTNHAAKRGLDMNDKDETLEAAKDTGNSTAAGVMPMITEGQIGRASCRERVYVLV